MYALEPPIDVHTSARRLFGDRVAADGNFVADNFASWFGESKVVERDGTPLRLFHGTTKDFESFDKRKHRGWATNNMLGMFFTRHAGSASDYACKLSGANVRPVYLSLRNPYVQNVYEWQAMQGSSLWSIERVRVWKRDLVKSGFDGVVDSVGVEFIAFRPEQIKSAIGNSGVFDPLSPSLCDEHGWDEAPAQVERERMRA